MEWSFHNPNVDTSFLKIGYELRSQQSIEASQLQDFAIVSRLRADAAQSLINFCCLGYESDRQGVYELASMSDVTRKKKAINLRKNVFCSWFTDQVRLHLVLECLELDFFHVWLAI